MDIHDFIVFTNAVAKQMVFEDLETHPDEDQQADYTDELLDLLLSDEELDNIENVVEVMPPSLSTREVWAEVIADILRKARHDFL